MSSRRLRSPTASPKRATVPAHQSRQVQIAEQNGKLQQAINSFKKGRQHVPVSLLPVIVQARDTTFNALIADAAAPTSKTTPKKRGPAANIQQQLERVSALPKAKQRTIAQVLDSMLAQADASGLCGEDYRIFWVSGTLDSIPRVNPISGGN